MDATKQNTHQLSIAARIDARRWREYAATADVLLKSCAALNPKEPTK